MKKAILFFLSLFSLTGCIKEGELGCPEGMFLSFTLKDDYVPGDYDSRIANDIQLYIFKDQKCVASKLIPYRDILSGSEYAIRKGNEISGNLDLVAWAVPSGADLMADRAPSIPVFKTGDLLDNLFLTMEKEGVTMQDCRAYPVELYMGTLSSNEVIDVPSHHLIEMIHVPCRVEVNVTDMGSLLAIPGAAPRVRVLGGLTEMNMKMKGAGEAACVMTQLENPSGDNVHFLTGRFGIMPCPEEEAITVEVMNGNDLIAILNVPEGIFPRAASAGGLMIFDYILGSDEFTLTIDGYRINIAIVSGI